MKKILSLLLTVVILLTSVINAVVVLANSNPVTTTTINLNDNYQYSVVKTSATSNTTITPGNGKLDVTVSAYERQLSGITSYSTKTWFPRYLLYKNSDMFTLTSGSKVIVEVKYKVIGSINENHGLQIGIGNNSAGSNTEIYVRNSRKHIAGDEGKEFTLSSSFVADSNNRIKIAFSGGGKLEITSIVVHELPAANINDYAVVKYVDGETEINEFVKKNTAPKVLADTSDFKGWYANSSFSGQAVTNITADITLYAKRISKKIYDIVRTESTTPDNLVGAVSEEVSISMSGNRISTASYNGYNLNSNNWYKWRPTFFFLTESGGTKSKFVTKQNSRYIVEMEYVVESPRTDKHSLQVGLFGGLKDQGQTESATWLDTDVNGTKHYNTHPAADNGKTINYIVEFTAKSSHNMGLVFYGHGSITLNKIKISELPEELISDYVTVSYNDSGKVSKEFVKKSAALKTPEKEYYEFVGWYDNSDFIGDPITSINENKTLYAKWQLDANSVVINFHNDNTTELIRYDVDSDLNKTPQKEGYNFLGWYKYSNYVGRPYTKAIKGLTDLYAKWEEINPQLEQFVDLTKNNVLKTTSKSAQSNLVLDGDKLVFEINNYERHLNTTDTNAKESWFPSYYFKDNNGNNIKFEFGTTYELEVTYKVVSVGAGDDVGLQIGFGADGQYNQTRTRIKGYKKHTKEDIDKEFTYSTTYTAEILIAHDADTGRPFEMSDHLPKLLFSGQGKFEVSSIKITKILPIIKDTVIGVQTYEDYEAKVDSGVLGNKKGTEVSTTANHTSGLFKNKSLKLDLNTEYLRLTGNTIISLKKNGELQPYNAEVGGAYRITFYMYANENMNNLHWSINSVDESMTKDYLKYFKMEKDGEISLKKGEWTEVVAYIPELKGGESSKNIFAIAVASKGYDGKSVYIDDVKIEQLVDSEVVFYDTMGGNELSPQRAFKNHEFISFKEPERAGYLFDGWYYDDQYLNEANVYDKFPINAEEITLYAKWIEAPTTAYDFTAGSFDPEIYNNVIPYKNMIADADTKFKGENQNGMTQNAFWVKDAGIYANGNSLSDGALAFSNEFFSNYTDKKSYNIVRLVNKDGTPYTVVKGERYTIKFDYIFASSKGLSYIVPIISEKSAYTAMGQSTSQTIGRVSVMETDTDYMTYSQSFVAEKTGYVYIALTGRDDNSNVDTHCYEKVYVDNLEIKRNTDVIKLDIKYGNTLWYTKYGIKGEKLILPNAVKSSTNTFDGLYFDPEFKTKFNGLYPAEDSTIYVKLKKDKYDTPSDFSNPIILEFEETDLLNDFYRQQKYMTSWSRETQNEWIFVTDDENNALSGKNYIKLNGFSHYWNQAKFALYDPNHSENVMLLDKGGKYRVTLMVRCEDLYESPVNMTICLENPSQQHLLAENGNVKLTYTPSGDKDGYFMFVGDIEVPSEMKYYPSLAIRRNANDLQTIFIDTVKVEKLRNCIVKYEENGGSPVDDAEVQIHDNLFDPGIPFKDGYVFDGWYIDATFSKLWDFDKDTVEDDMTLYAKWSVEVIEETEDDFNDFDDDDSYIDEESDTEEDNGTRPNLIDADKVEINNTDLNNTDSGMPLWLIIVICSGSAVLLAASTFVTIILIRKKRNK